MNLKRLLFLVMCLLIASVLFLISPELMMVSIFIVFMVYLYKTEKEMFMEIVFPFVFVPLAVCRWVLDEEKDKEES